VLIQACSVFCAMLDVIIIRGVGVYVSVCVYLNGYVQVVWQLSGS